MFTIAHRGSQARMCAGGSQIVAIARHSARFSSGAPGLKMIF